LQVFTCLHYKTYREATVVLSEGLYQLSAADLKTKKKEKKEATHALLCWL